MEGREKVASILSSSSFLTVYEADVCAAAEKVHDDGGQLLQIVPPGPNGAVSLTTLSITQK